MVRGNRSRHGTAATSTGRKKVPTTPARAASSEPVSKSRKAKIRRHRKDIELLYDGLPEPIDLDLDIAARMMYWTDRGDPPRGNTVNRAPMDAQSGRREDPKIIFNHLMEGIGLALDLKNARMFLTDLGGSVYRCNLDGSEKKALLLRKET